MVASFPPAQCSAERLHSQTLPRDHQPVAERKIVLAGNPNVGKSAIFNALTGLNAEVSNYPGTTIDVSRGKLGRQEIVDTPGVYGISSFNDEERVARGIILESDLVINVVSALSLDRDLFLTLQLIALGKPMLLVINQWDEAQARNLSIDTAGLSARLGIPVVTTVATRKQGIAAISEALGTATIGSISPALAGIFAEVRETLPAACRQDLLLLALEADEPSRRQLGQNVPDLRTTIYRQRRQEVNELFQRCVTQSGSRQNLSVKLGRLLLHPIAGSAIAIAICYLIFYQLLGIVVAGKIVDWTEKRLLRTYYEPGVRRLTAVVFPSAVTAGDTTFYLPHGSGFNNSRAAALDAAISRLPAADVKYDFWRVHSLWAAVGNILSGEYGVLTLTVTYLLGLLMPLVIAFYLALSLLEDSGYLPRLAVLVDRLLNKVGLNGRAIIPLILGLGCVTMATVTTRLLTSRREKIIATALLGVAIPCSAQLGIVSGTLAKCGGALPWLVYGAVIGGMLAITGVLLNMVMPGKSEPLMIDLPPMRLPRWENVLQKTWTKSWNFMKESIPMFCLAGLVVSVGEMTGILDWFINILQPMTVSWLHLPADPRIPTTFILGIVRRDFAAFGLTDVALTGVQAVVAMVVITLFVPCIATVGVMIKERGMKTAMAIWIGSWLCAFIIGGALTHLLRYIM
jgi:ferrous iron transport protein B